MDTTTKAIIVLGGIALGSYVGTQLMLRFPGSKAWMEKKLIEAYAYLDAHQDEVPQEAMGVWKAAYDLCDWTLQAIADGQLTWKETRVMGLKIIVAVNEVRKVVNGLR